MDRDQILRELKLRVKSEDVLRHSFAVEAIMRIFGRHFKDDEGKWALTGLLHDIDYEKCTDPQKRHGEICEEILEGLGADDFIIYAIRAHNDQNGYERKRKLDKILYSANPLATIILAAIDQLSSKSFDDLDEAVVLNYLKDESFLKNIDRTPIRACVEAGVKFEDFIKISIQGIKNGKDDIMMKI